MLLTGIIEKTYPFNNEISIDSTLEIKENTINLLEDNISKDAKDSINIDIKNQKVFLYGNAKIEYLDIKIESGFIEIDWKTNIITAKPQIDSLGKLIEIPYFNKEIATIPDSNNRDLDNIVQSAKLAFPSWASLDIRDRAEVMFNLKAIMERNMDELAELIALDNLSFL